VFYLFKCVFNLSKHDDMCFVIAERSMKHFIGYTSFALDDLSNHMVL